MAVERPSDWVAKAVQAAMEDSIRKIVEEEAAAASDRVFKRVREETARIALSLIQSYELEHMRDHLLIRVKIDDGSR